MESLSLYVPINFHVHTLSPNQSKYADFQENTLPSLKNDLSKIQIEGQKGYLILCPLLNIFNWTSGTEPVTLRAEALREPVHARIIQKFTYAPKGWTIRKLMKGVGVPVDSFLKQCDIVFVFYYFAIALLGAVKLIIFDRITDNSLLRLIGQMLLQ